MVQHRLKQFLRIASSVGITSGIVVVCQSYSHFNATTTALAMVLAILLIATRWGFGEAILASIAGGLGFDYFFLPPRGIGIEEPQYWVAQITFLATAIIGSRLSTNAKRRAAEAHLRREEVERLNNLQRLIYGDHPVLTNLHRIPELIEEAFAFGGVACYFGGVEELHRCGPRASLIPADLARRVASTREVFVDKDRGLRLVPMTHGKSGGSLGVHGSVSSVTLLHTVANLVVAELERARTLKEAQEAEAARRSEALKSVVLDALAHDLKTPLTAIKAAVTCLLTQELNPNRELLSVINEETDLLNQLVGETIDIARIEAGSIQLEKDRYDIKALIDAALEEMEQVLASRPIQVQSQVDLPQVEFDFSLVKQVLKQLLDNAVKYSPAGSPVTISCESSSDSIVVHVVDTGAGIPEKQQEQIFERFYRGKSGGEVPGTGMGLAIAKRIVEAHNGRIWVSSRPGMGSVFHFSLPSGQEVALSAAKQF